MKTRGRTVAVRGMSRMQNFDYMVAVPFVWIDASRRSYTSTATHLTYLRQTKRPRSRLLSLHSGLALESPIQVPMLHIAIFYRAYYAITGEILAHIALRFLRSHPPLPTAVDMNFAVGEGNHPA